MNRERIPVGGGAGRLLAAAAVLVPLSILVPPAPFFALVPPAAAQANLQPYQPAGWALPIVPRGAADAAWNNVPAPATLPGNAASTYWNESCWNAGGTTTGVTFQNQLRIDGASTASYGWPILPPSSYSTHTNGGPLTVRGGRHTFELRVDSGGAVAESNEADNNLARQWVWTPLTLAAGAEAARAAPPARTGGWESIPAGQDKYNNCDGLRFATGSGWNVVFVNGLTEDADCDVYLHSPSAGATSGFAAALASSERAAGGLDGVIANGHQVGAQTYDVGVVDYLDAGPYVVKHLASQSLVYGGNAVVNGTLATNEMLKIWDVYVAPAYAGGITVTLQMGEPGPSLMLHQYGTSYTVGGLENASAAAATSSSGRAFLNFETGYGYFALVLMRDIAWGAGPRSFTLKITPYLPNTTPHAPAGWHAPIVPRPANDGLPTLVALPDTLNGTSLMASTYLNFCGANLGLGADGYAWDGTYYLDGGWLGELLLGPLAPSGTARINLSSPFLIGGGRHTLTLRTNVHRYEEESTYDDNAYAEQYCWSPWVLSFYQIWSRQAPPDAWADQGILGSGETYYPNCDGFRLPPSDGNSAGTWRAVAVMPRGTSDVDVALHPPLTGVKNGFAATLAVSDWGAMHSDWILVRDGLTSSAPYDVGVRRGSGTEGYAIQAVEPAQAYYLTDYLTVPGTIGNGEVLHLIDICPPAVGTMELCLDNVAGSVNWGLAVYDYDDGAVQAKSDGLLANDSGPGGGECLTLAVTQPWRVYAVVVYKTGSPDLDLIGSYNLRLGANVTAVPGPDPVPARTALLGASPNPFNPRTVVRYELDRAAPVQLTIHDAAGRRVRTLFAGEQAAGRHEAFWDGRSDAGAAAPSGVYFCRLEAGEQRQTVKLTLLK